MTNDLLSNLRTLSVLRRTSPNAPNREPDHPSGDELPEELPGRDRLNHVKRYVARLFKKKSGNH